MSEVLEKIKKTFEVAEKRHRLWESEWEEAARYMLPKAGGFYNANLINAPKDSSQIYDPTPRIAVRKSSAALYSYSANPHTEWYGFGIPAKKGSAVAYSDIIKNSEVKSYIEELSSTCRRFLNNALVSTLRYAYDEMIVFSTHGIFLKEEDGPEAMSTYNMELKNLYPLSDGNGKVNCIFRKIYLTPQQARNKFGYDTLASTVKECLNTSQSLEKEHLYIHAVYRRDQYDIIPDIPTPENMPWASVYIDYSNSHLISESGFLEQPFGLGCLSPLGGDVFGNAPGTDALPAVRSLNKLAAQQLEIGDSALAPSFNVPTGVYKRQLNLNPYALNYYNPERAVGGQLAAPINKYAGYTIGERVLAQQQEKVREALYDLVVDAPKGNTTYEAQQGFINQLIMMSPWNYSLENNLYKPLIKRAFNILSRKQMLPAPPQMLIDYLGGTPLDIVFDNPLSRASQFPQLQAMDRTLQVAGNLAPVGGMYMINIFKTIEIYRKFAGAPQEMVYSTDEAERRKKADEKAKAEAMQQMQQQQEAQGAVQLSQAYKNVAQAERQ